MKSAVGLLLVVLTGCKEPIAHSPGGYPYPEQIEEVDTTFYYYPLKDVEPRDIAFGDSYQYRMYERYEEANISLRPLPSETLRLTYRDAFGEEAIIVLTEGSITVKKGNSGDLSYSDKLLLTDLERLHLAILDRYYPIDISDKNINTKNYLDSMIRHYPELLDVDYYHRIYEKQFVSTGKKFRFTTYKFSISDQQYHSIFRQISSSGFWAMQNFIPCDKTIADGELFTLEANTKRQYQKVSIQSCPDNKTEFTLACQNLVSIAKLDKEINLVWEN